LRTGRFTSPHLIDRWDCINIDEKPISEAIFREVESRILRRNEDNKIGASEFELLTATAFEVFNQEEVEVGIIEVGMGGRLDATNILEKPLVTVISRIGLDHQAFLGGTIEEIAREKAGILKPGVECVVDGSNEEPIRKVIAEVAAEVNAGSVYFRDCLPGGAKANRLGFESVVKRWKALTKAKRAERHQRINVGVAFKAVALIWPKIRKDENLTASDVLPAVIDVKNPGRLERLSITSLTGRKKDILLDGAHNAQSANALSYFVEWNYRRTKDTLPPAYLTVGTVKGASVTWVLAFSKKGEDMRKIVAALLHTGDTVVTTEFGPVDGMSWVKPTPAGEAADLVQELGIAKDIYPCGNDVLAALRKGTELANGGPLIVAGSLYLVSDVLRMLGKKEPDESKKIPKRPRGRPRLISK